MKRVSLYLLIGLFIMMISIIPTHAKEYKVNTLIPVDQVATVHTERFDYIDFSFLSKINEKGNGTIQFSSIHIAPLPSIMRDQGWSMISH